MIITIDGPTGTGKSTIATLLAHQLGFVHFDTGAMYRCVTYGVLKHNIDPDRLDALEALVKNFDFTIKIIKGTKHYFFEGEDISEKIRQEPVTALVSKVSAVQCVREKLVEVQRSFAHGVDSVFEGRDIGTVVFPSAELKIYLTARPEIRAQRRFEELKSKFPDDNKLLRFEDVLISVNKRDHYDSTRKLSPLKPASDAHLIDTSDLTIDQVIQAIIEIKNGEHPQK